MTVLQRLDLRDEEKKQARLVLTEVVRVRKIHRRKDLSKPARSELVKEVIKNLVMQSNELKGIERYVVLM